MAGVIVAVLAIGVIVVAVTRRGSTPPASPAPAPAAGARYQSLSDATITTCPPPSPPSALTAFDTCLTTYNGSLDALELPATLASTVQDAHEVIQQLLTCRSHQLHEDATMREWPVGCPQSGPAAVPAADPEDMAFRQQYYALLMHDDAVIRSALGLTVRGAPSP